MRSKGGAAVIGARWQPVPLGHRVALLPSSLIARHIGSAGMARHDMPLPPGSARYRRIQSRNRMRAGRNNAETPRLC